jgi:pyruvate/2-oxoglutarate dehydrogenase complex dihydrolipoamide dehydrogenase (E3) component
MERFDLVILGGGSAGYNAARVASDLALKVAVVDGARVLGGLCILRGCMPSKTLIYAAEVLHRAREGGALGLRIARATADMKAVHARKNRIIGDFARYRARQLAGGAFKLFRSQARFADPHTVELADGKKIAAKHVLIATGSRVGVPAVPGLGSVGFWTSDDILDLDVVPRSVVVLGGGVVACELAQFLRRIGSRVALVQRSPHLLRDHSPEASAVVEKALRDEGIEVWTGTAIQELSRDKGGVSVAFLHGGKKRMCRADHCLNALGREPNVSGLNLAAAGVALAPNGQVAINRWQQTSAPHIYAAGDCSGPVEIVHVAIQQGELAARHAAGVEGLKPVDYSLLLNVVFTDPQVAGIGLSEAVLKTRGTPFLRASYPFDDHGRSILMNAPYGHVKVLAEPRRGRILGAEIVGRDAGELIHCFSGPLAMRATVFDLLRAPWYHPTLSEIITYPLEELAERVGR